MILGKTMVLLADVSGSTIPTPTSVPGEVPYRVSDFDNILKLVELVFILIFILVAAYFVSKYAAKLSLGHLKNNNFKVIDTYRISPNKFLQIVQVANKYIVISVCKDAVHFITELDEAEVIVRERNAKENIGFQQIFDKVRKKTEK